MKMGLETEERRTATQSELSPILDRHPAYAFALLSAFYLIVVFSLSSFKLLWFDELVTLHIARLGSATAIWHALAHAADPNPPLVHLAVRASRAVFGEHEWALRLPAMAGYWLGMAALFAFLRRRLPGGWALAGTLLSMTNGGFDYSFESRSYGLLYGFTMLALLAWSRAVDDAAPPTRRACALAAMMVSLALAVSTNYFAVLAVVPLACGEAVRTCATPSPPDRSRTELDPKIWLGLLLALSPILAYRPLIVRSVAQYAPHAFNRVSATQIVGSYTEMIEYVLYPVLFLFAILLVQRLKTRAPGSASPSARALPPHEVAAALTLALYPVLGYGLASLYGGMFSPRLVIPVCLGIAILGASASFCVFGRLRQASTIACVFLFAWFVSREIFVGYTYKNQKESFYRIVNAFPATSTSGPIAITDPLMSLTFVHYAPPTLSRRVVLPIDFPAIHALRGDDSPEENLWAGRRDVYPLPIVGLEQLQRTSANYLILAADGNWLVETLKQRNYPVERLPIDPHADDIGGFTPLAHGAPAFFLASGDLAAPPLPQAASSRDRVASMSPLLLPERPHPLVPSRLETSH